ncbi:hypothetical protein DFS34DRAFT_646043 [Phlyctochytrium arcticum]|nr:hypothetical protein DFS34DRAFT_646043 [Phlyctochytrium arcticum]
MDVRQQAAQIPKVPGFTTTCTGSSRLNACNTQLSGGCPHPVNAWTLIHPLWIAGYPEIENTTPIKMRPKRRTAMLALAMTAWQECREELLKTYKLAANHPDATPVRKAMIDAILWVLNEAIPLSVDCVTGSGSFILAAGGRMTCVIGP